MAAELTMIDLFAGVGGLSLGFERAGFKVVLANEFDPSIAEAYIRNRQNPNMIVEDIRKLPIHETFGDYKGKVTVIVGGPPCQGYSQKGQRKTIHDERNFLFRYFVDVVREVEPEYFVMENVPNLLTNEGGYFKRELISLFNEIGYTVNADVLCAADYGVPQDRRRAFIIGKRGEYNSKIEVLDAYFVSIEDGEGGGNPPTSDVGSVDSPKTVAEALAAINALEDGATTDAKWYVKGKVAKVATKADEIGPNTEKKYKDINYYISEDGSESNTIYVYRGKNLNNTDFTSADQLQVGDDVVVYGKLQKYKNTNTGEIVPEMAQGNYLVKTSNANASSGGEGGGSGEGGGGEAASELTNGNFETWADGLPTGWKSASTASSATLEQSTDAHGGNYSVLVKGGGTANKRLASQEIKLAAGTYVFAFYAKAVTSDVSQARPGYAIVINGAIANSDYKYGNYSTLSNSEWTLIKNEFTLDAETTVCLLVMNPKANSDKTSGKDILVDDATLTKK